MNATAFKAKCLEILDTVQETGESVLVTKHGKVVAELCPAGGEARRAKFGFAQGQIEIFGDVTEPVDEPWEALGGS